MADPIVDLAAEEDKWEDIVPNTEKYKYLSENGNIAKIWLSNLATLRYVSTFSKCS